MSTNQGDIPGEKNEVAEAIMADWPPVVRGWIQELQRLGMHVELTPRAGDKIKIEIRVG